MRPYELKDPLSMPRCYWEWYVKKNVQKMTFRSNKSKISITILSHNAVYKTITVAALSSFIDEHNKRPSHALIATLLSCITQMRDGILFSYNHSAVQRSFKMKKLKNCCGEL